MVVPALPWWDGGEAHTGVLRLRAKHSRESMLKDGALWARGSSGDEGTWDYPAAV